MLPVLLSRPSSEGELEQAASSERVANVAMMLAERANREMIKYKLIPLSPVSKASG